MICLHNWTSPQVAVNDYINNSIHQPSNMYEKVGMISWTSASSAMVLWNIKQLHVALWAAWHQKDMSIDLSLVVAWWDRTSWIFSWGVWSWSGWKVSEHVLRCIEKSFLDVTGGQNTTWMLCFHCVLYIKLQWLYEFWCISQWSDAGPDEVPTWPATMFKIHPAAQQIEHLGWWTAHYACGFSSNTVNLVLR